MYQEQTIVKRQIIAPPGAQLFVGSSDATTDHAIRSMQSILCNRGGCHACSSCTAIANQKHYALLWVSPEERYTLDDIQPIHDTIAFALDDESHFFFILSNADRLSLSCANTLLKIVEEPPAGYHFIFLTEQREAILPTIRSRCVIQTINTGTLAAPTNPLLPFFISTALDNPSQFLSLLDENKMGEREALSLVNTLLQQWNDRYKKAQSTLETDDACHALSVLHRALEQPPMPGSTKLFLKNLYLHIKKLPL
jgi:DNA polymerase III gamma/tau subunit